MAEGCERPDCALGNMGTYVHMTWVEVPSSIIPGETMPVLEVTYCPSEGRDDG